MKIYIVEGTTGEYSDRTDWVVCAYRSKTKAEKHASNAMHRAKELEKAGYGRYSKGRLNEFDPDMKIDYTGTSYYTVKCEGVDI